jgi:hypothetical protein
MTGWSPDWWQLCQDIVQFGLPVRVLGVSWFDDLLVLAVDVPEAVLPRTHADRGFELHLSLLFREELNAELHARAEAVHARWTGRRLLLPVEWVGSGGAAMLASTHPLASDPDIIALHDAGSFRDRQLHISL